MPGLLVPQRFLVPFLPTFFRTPFVVSLLYFIKSSISPLPCCLCIFGSAISLIVTFTNSYLFTHPADTKQHDHKFEMLLPCPPVKCKSNISVLCPFTPTSFGPNLWTFQFVSEPKLQVWKQNIPQFRQPNLRLTKRGDVGQDQIEPWFGLFSCVKTRAVVKSIFVQSKTRTSRDQVQRGSSPSQGWV